MSIQIYKPNSKNTGSAYTFSQSTSKTNGEPVFYISAIAQHSWNDEKKTGSFAGNSKNPEKTINVKITPNEAGEFISSFTDRRDFNTFHSYGGSNTTIKLSPWDKQGKISKYNASTKSFQDEKLILPCFGITLSKGKSNSIKIALDPGEIEIVKSSLNLFLQGYIKFKSSEQRNYNQEPSSQGSEAGDTELEGEEAPF